MALDLFLLPIQNHKFKYYFLYGHQICVLMTFLTNNVENCKISHVVGHESDNSKSSMLHLGGVDKSSLGYWKPHCDVPKDQKLNTLL